MTVSRHIPPHSAGLLTDKQVAERLNVSARTAREYRYDGRLPTITLGYRTKRVDPAAVDRLIRARTR